MNPLPWVHHNLSFQIYLPTQTRIEDIEIVDVERNNRKVKVKFCMPTKPGRWPLYLFGHGAGCAPEDYQYFCQVAATASIYQDSPVGPVFTADFDNANAALDMAFLARELPVRSRDDPASSFYGKLDGSVIGGGHSMGGG